MGAILPYPDLTPADTLAVFQTSRPRVVPRGMTSADTDQALVIPDVVISEEQSDSMTVTDHPVEKGVAAFVSDHAYREPAELNLQYGWSPTGPGNGRGPSGLLDTVLGKTSRSPTYIKDIYNQLLELQAARTLLNIYTGKRAYKNMLIQQLSLSTETATENALILRISCREIIIAFVEVTQVGLDPTTILDPEKGLSVMQNGPQQLQDASTFDSSDYDRINAIGITQP